MSAGHLDYDVLAELAEGLLPESQAASADAHLAGCADCRDRSAEIEDVSRLLATAPVPPMPAELASRIDDALAAEASTTAAPVLSLESRRGRRRVRILSAAAAAVVVVGGGTIVGHSLLSGSVSSDNGAAQSQAVQDRTGSARARQPAAPGAASGPSALKAPAEGDGSGTSGSAGGAGGYPAVRSGTDYSATALRRQISAQLNHQGNVAKAVGPSTERLAGCVRLVTRGRTPVLVDIATYEGRPATVIVAPATGGGSGRLDVWVVGPACSASSPALITHSQTAG